ncbi:unnamed protein product [Gordionus sp. m RMFG-2023]|uniref:protein PF3D7_1417600-like n=1 Tax=Gordionus sp. m RMFG-2023 TaxID=3053472 RepID=UPI0030DFF37D
MNTNTKNSDYLTLAKTNVLNHSWINEFNPNNLLNYENMNISVENILDKSDYVTAEETSTILINKMKILQNMYIDHLKTLKREYINERIKMVDYIKDKEKNLRTTDYIDQQSSASTKTDLNERQMLLKAYTRYHRPHGKEGDFIIRSRNRRWQFTNFFDQKYLRKKYKNFLDNNDLTMSSSQKPIQVRCHYFLNEDNKDFLNGNSSGDIMSELLEVKITHNLKSEQNKPPDDDYKCTSYLSQNLKNIKRNRNRKNSGRAGGRSKNRNRVKSISSLDFTDVIENLDAKLSDNDGKRCDKISLPFSKYCHNHVLYDKKQKLFVPCDKDNVFFDENKCDKEINFNHITSTLNISNVKCKVPILDISIFDQCPLHVISNKL